MLKMFTILLTGILLAAGAENISMEFMQDFEGWGNWESEHSMVQFLHDPALGRKAPGSLSILLNPGHPEGKSVCFTKHFEVQPGQTYTGLVYVKASGIADQANISFAFQGQDAKRNFLGTEVQSTRISGRDLHSGEWKRLVYTIRIPDTGKWQQVGCLLCTMGINQTDKGQVWFDDFQFFLNP